MMAWQVSGQYCALWTEPDCRRENRTSAAVRAGLGGLEVSVAKVRGLFLLAWNKWVQQGLLTIPWAAGWRCDTGT